MTVKTKFITLSAGVLDELSTKKFLVRKEEEGLNRHFTKEGIISRISTEKIPGPHGFIHEFY